MLSKGQEIREILRDAAATLELTWLGVVEIGLEPDFPHYVRWLDEKRHAGMSYLERNLDVRQDPRLLLTGARSVIILGFSYYLGDKLRPLMGKGPPRIAQYARFRDYHRELRERCEVVAGRLREFFAPDIVNTRVLVDSAPILERSLAARGGAGFIGKNTCFISPKAGSWLLLAEILTTYPLPASPRPLIDNSKRTSVGGCGTCQRCQIYCPTGALDQAYSLDANRCLAYWTIEHRGTIPEHIWPWLGEYYFGCDICQLVCPYNRLAVKQTNQAFLKLKSPPTLFEVAVMDQVGYERMFGGTPMTRAKRCGLKRNALIAMTVTGDPQLEEALERSVINETDPVVAQTVDQIRYWLLNRQTTT